jgi:hypothetical protein
MSLLLLLNGFIHLMNSIFCKRQIATRWRQEAKHDSVVLLLSLLGLIAGARWSTHVSNYLLVPKGKDMEWIRRDDPPLEFQLLQRRWRGSEC